MSENKNENGKYENMDPIEAMSIVRENAKNAVSIGKSLGIRSDSDTEKKMKLAFQEIGKIINKGRTLSQLNEELASNLPQNIIAKVFYFVTDTAHITDREARYQRKADIYTLGLNGYIKNAINACTLNAENVITPILREACATRDRHVVELENSKDNYEMCRLEIEQLKRNVEENEKIKNAASAGKKIFDKKRKEDVKEINRSNSYHKSVIEAKGIQIEELAGVISRKESDIKKYDAAIEELMNYRYLVTVNLNKLSELEELSFIENIDRSMGNFTTFTAYTTPHINNYASLIRKKEEVRDGQMARLLALNAVNVDTKKESSIAGIISGMRKTLIERVDEIIDERAS